MPSHNTGNSSPELQRLTEALTKYIVLFETCGQCIRVLPDRKQLRKEALEKWKLQSEFYQPSRGDETARVKFFSAVDEVCKIESRSPEKCALYSSLHILIYLIYLLKLLSDHFCLFSWHSSNHESRLHEAQSIGTAQALE
jgi:hypothetical protein